MQLTLFSEICKQNYLKTVLMSILCGLLFLEKDKVEISCFHDHI